MTQHYPTNAAAATHNDTGVATTDPLAQARAVVADFIHYPDSAVIAAARVIAKHSPMPTERGEAEELIFWMEGPK